MNSESKTSYCHIQPRYGRYGICGWDVMIVGMANILFSTKRLAKKWASSNGYSMLG